MEKNLVLLQRYWFKQNVPVSSAGVRTPGDETHDAWYHHFCPLSYFTSQSDQLPQSAQDPGTGLKGHICKMFALGRNIDITFQTRSSVCPRPRRCQRDLLDMGWSRGSQLQGCRGHSCRNTGSCTQVWFSPSEPWNNGKDYRMIQKMSPSTTGRCK